MGTVDELYQTSREVENLLMQYYQNIDENGMVIDEHEHDQLKEELVGKEGDKNEKLLSLAHSVKRRRGEIDMIIAEEKRFVSRKKRLHSEIIGIENIIKQYLELDKKLFNGLVTVKWKGEYNLVITREDLIPAMYKTEKHTSSIDKPALQKALGKVEIDGAYLHYVKKLKIS